jgi:hypothetical protein
MECGGGSARADGWHSENGGEASSCKGGAPTAGVETGEQHAVGAVKQDRLQSGCAKHYRTHALLTTCESILLVSFAHRQLMMMLTAKHWLGSPSAWMARSGR